MATPAIVPMAVPMHPMISPCSMKMYMTLRDVAPIVLRIAMSAVFSITSSTSDATMLSAATMTMRPMVIDTAIFSSHSASNSVRFIVVQSCVT